MSGDDKVERAATLRQCDVILVFWAETSDVARIIGDALHKNGYMVDLVADGGYDPAVVDRRVTAVVPVVAGDCATHFVFDDATVTVWPNNCAKPSGLPVAFSTIDMAGTDFETSLDKACERFPEELKEKNKGIRSDIKYGKWADILSEYPELADLCPFDQIDGDGWRSLLSKQPQFASKCEWDKLSGIDWRYLLSEKPEFSDRCDWSKLDGGDWATLLSVQPGLSEYCDWSKIKECYDWVGLISKQPIDEFVNRCDFSKIDGWRWVELIVAQPQFAARCDWGKLNGKNWAELLSKKPEFAERCDWKKIGSEAWADLLVAKPEFADKCSWTKLSGESWAKLLSNGLFADKCDWSKLVPVNWWQVFFWGGKWDVLFADAPELSKYCDLKRFCRICRGYHIVAQQLSKFKVARDYDWKSLDKEDWRILLFAHPELKSNCPYEFVESQEKTAVEEKHAVERKCVDPDEEKMRYDVFIASTNSGRIAAKRLCEALEKRQYSVYVDESDEFSEEDRDAINAAKYFMLIRSEGLFSEIIVDKSPMAGQIEYAIEQGKRMISVGPTDQKWQDARHLPDALKSIETDQVKNLDMGDLFEEKVDALVRESMKSERGSLAKKYDVFISYRRATGDEVARRIHQQLKEMGYLAFLDYDCILNGKYDKVIRSAIDSAPVFISLLTDASLDRCAESEDWVRAEIQMALESGKCFIPVTPDNQHWSIPDNLPKELDALRSCNVSTLEMSGDFAGSIKKMADRFPADVRKKAKEIHAAVQNPGDTRTIGDAHDTPLTDVLKKWPDAISLFNYREFGRNEWKLIMCIVPELASKCDWSKLAHFDIVDILKTRPELADLCDFSCFEGWNWACLLRDHPEFAKICEWHKFTGEDWNCLYRDNPKLAKKYEHLRDWSKLDGGDWVELLKKRPEFADKCDWGKFDGFDLAKLLKARPELVDECDLSVMNGDTWADVLSENPDLAANCNDWWMFDGDCWAQVLREWPCNEFESHCNWNMLNGSNWVAILTSEKLHLFSDDSVPKKVREDLLSRFRRWTDECQKHANGSDWSGVDGSDWARLLMNCPQLSDYCDWSRLEQDDWNCLLRTRSEFKDRCIANGFKVPVDYGVPMIEHKHHRPMSEEDFEDAVTDLELEYVGEEEDEFKHEGKFLKWEEAESDDDDDFATMLHVEFEVAFDDGWSDGYAVVYGRLSLGISYEVLSVDDIGIRIDGGNHEVPELERYLKDTLSCLRGESGGNGLLEWSADNGSGECFISVADIDD